MALKKKKASSGGILTTLQETKKKNKCMPIVLTASLYTVQSVAVAFVCCSFPKKPTIKLVVFQNVQNPDLYIFSYSSGHKL